MELPLITRAQQEDALFCLTIADAAAEGEFASMCGAGTQVTLPPPPGPGEQYRFHFEMAKCIGCKCCVVACNEQNGNPADILWRRVGEIEGGTYPNTQRHYLSMGCNHCLEPTCMSGCPVDAYSKDGITGIVRHSADACIGCQYCTWNCSYGVPQYNPERGVVGKCDMCYGRLTQGQQPACVAACPEGAIRIETVKVAEWRNEYHAAANAPGMPSADDSLSTTRITTPARMPADVQKVNLNQLKAEHPHWPLIVMTVLTQLSVGGFTAIWLLQAAGTRTNRGAALVALSVAMLALAASTLHLGRPIYAMRALKMWRRSWLSREVLLFTLFAGVAFAYSGSLLLDASMSGVLGAATAVLGAAGVCASARLYLAPGRPAWNSPFTIAEFLLTAFLLGATGAELLTAGGSAAKTVLTAAACGTVISAASKLVWLRSSRMHERRGTWQLLTGALSGKLLLRGALFVVGVLMLLFAEHMWARGAGAALVIGGEWMSRYLFFVSVVPTNMATGYLSAEAA